MLAAFAGTFAVSAGSFSLGMRAHAKTAAGEGKAKPVLLPALQKYVQALPAAFDAIPADRKPQLEKLALFIKTQRDSGQTARLVFICTHNSRRSHMGQLFATAAAAHYGIDRVESFSGGTEATAFNPRAVAALKRAGFSIDNPSGDNPHYKVKFAEERPAVEAFSKKYDDAFNPTKGFAAIMTCSHADKNCPTVAGASIRVPVHYEDPKVSDGTPEEAATYDARAKQIATELFYVFSRIKA
ncbi:MAG: protein-tyrosine-phosphatase [Deltaproteobacteria bacterium]|nr:protein-tyrosine-phosphatase [Deltaproteobacteria bacterium]